MDMTRAKIEVFATPVVAGGVAMMTCIVRRDNRTEERTLRVMGRITTKESPQYLSLCTTDVSGLCEQKGHPTGGAVPANRIWRRG